MDLPSFFNSAPATVRRLVVAVLALASLSAFAERPQAKKAAGDDEALIRRPEERIKQDLQEGPWLKEQIERGIQEYIQQEKAAKAAARAEQEKNLAEKAKTIRPVDKTRDHIYGNPDAEVSLIEYSDFECPYCKRFHPTPKQLVDSSGGKVNWVFRHFPLPGHNPSAQRLAEAAECAAVLGGNDAFWKYADALYARNQGGSAPEQLIQIATSHGLDGNDFKDCLDSGRFAGRVKEDLAEGMRIGITGTPGNMLRDHKKTTVRIRTGNAPLAALKYEIYLLAN